MKLKYLLIICLFSCIQPEDNKPVTTPQKEQNKETGVHKEFYPNGKLKIIGDRVNNLRQGVWKSYYENGNLWSEAEYLHDKRNGIYKTYYPNGKLKIHGLYENGVKKDTWYFYNDKGQFEKEVNF